MAKQILSDKTLRSVKPIDDQQLNDGGGLYLLIKPMARSGGDLITDVSTLFRTHF
jgi:hypothetical protein